MNKIDMGGNERQHLGPSSRLNIDQSLNHAIHIMLSERDLHLHGKGDG
jgi:hypothetical protein